MLAILSPAKKLDFLNPVNTQQFSEPDFLDDSQKLINKLKKLSPNKIGKLMSVSDDIAELNFNRYQDWELPFDPAKTRQAMFAFDGEAYRGLNAPSMSEAEIERAQKHLRILSGLYGVLKPLDAILPYRLEMGTSIGAGKAKNLYEFWKKKATDEINHALLLQGDDILVNVASNEYYKALDPKKIKGTIITCVFKEFKNGDYKAIMTFAKRARGMMARYIIDQNPKRTEDLYHFDSEGYMFNEPLSNENTLVFTRG